MFIFDWNFSYSVDSKELSLKKYQTVIQADR